MSCDDDQTLPSSLYQPSFYINPQGYLVCLDRDMNLIIEAGVEFHNALTEQDNLSLCGENIISKSIGMTMIPGAAVVKILCMKS